MNMPSMLALFICLQEACTAVTGTRWLLITTLPANRIRKEADCDGFNWLEKRQKTVCRRNLEMMETIRRGAIEAVDQCQQQFVSRRWNCSVAKRSGNSTGGLLGKVMNFGTREAAFVHALSSAGVAHSVTRACSSGTFERCGCDGSMAEERTAGQDRSTNPSWHSARVAAGGSNFEWAGCSDNVAYGTALSRSFVDGREKIRGKTAMRGLMNLHNNRAGLKAVEESVQTQCKCHGVSGSCEMKTCWRSLAKFHTVAATLKDKFDGAIEVEERRTSSKRELAPRITQFRPPTESDLVYLDASPDFCEPDPKTGSLGTHLRLCNRTSKGMDGCELMCCGRGFNTRRTIVKERCHCKFHWCCSVKCQTCQREVEEHFCR